jgi:hypothetical protein
MGHPTSKANFKGPTSKAQLQTPDFKDQRDKKKKRDKHFVYPAFVLRKIVPGEIAFTSWPGSVDRPAHLGDALDSPGDCRVRG